MHACTCTCTVFVDQTLLSISNPSRIVATPFDVPNEIVAALKYILATAHIRIACVHMNKPRDL